jgi:hypothetical protein
MTGKYVVAPADALMLLMTIAALMLVCAAVAFAAAVAGLF